MITRCLIVVCAMLISVAAVAQSMPDAFTKAAPLNLPDTYMPETLPPEPPDPELHAHWAKMLHMKSIVPKLKNRSFYHHPADPPGNLQGGPVGRAIPVSFQNWSGSGVVGSPGQFATGATAFATVVSTNTTAFGTNCPSDNTLRANAEWTGYDGLGGSTVEQAGIWITQVGCQKPQYGAFIETYPNYEVTVSNFPVSPGDLIWTWLYIRQSTRDVCATWENETQGVTTGACLVAPGAFPASTLEWVVERPIYNNAYVPLTNYLAMGVWGGTAWDYTTNNVWTSAAWDWNSHGQFYTISMTDNSGGRISYPTLKYYDSLLMHVDGSAYCVPGTTCQPPY